MFQLSANWRQSRGGTSQGSGSKPKLTFEKSASSLFFWLEARKTGPGLNQVWWSELWSSFLTPRFLKSSGSYWGQIKFRLVPPQRPSQARVESSTAPIFFASPKPKHSKDLRPELKNFISEIFFGLAFNRTSVRVSWPSSSFSFSSSSWRK